MHWGCFKYMHCLHVWQPPHVCVQWICHVIPVCVLLANHNAVTPVGFEPTPFRTGALSQRLRPLGQSVMAAAPTAMQHVLHAAMKEERGMKCAPASFTSSLPCCRFVLFQSKLESGSTGRMLSWLQGCLLLLGWLAFKCCPARGL